jgi:small subunit ribosomal protein S2
VAQVGIRELLEAGVHFGHQTRRWNPKMRRFIHGERGGIYIIDLLKTADLLAQAQDFASQIAHRGGVVLFVGTKKQARDTVAEVAANAGMPFVNHRWLGGLLTNFQTINQRIRRLHDLERFETEGQLALLPTRERMSAQADLAKLRANLGGVKNMQRVPDAMFVIDLKTEVIAVREAQRLRVPIIGLVDTNCDPDGIDYVIPGNDDAIRSCSLITRAIGEVVGEGHAIFRAEEERARAEAEERARREAEERARRQAEEQAKREAEEQAQREAAERAERERQAALTGAGEGQPRQEAEAAVAAAAQSGGRPQPDPKVAPRANDPGEHHDPTAGPRGHAPTAEADEPIVNPERAEAAESPAAPAAAAPAPAPAAEAPAPTTAPPPEQNAAPAPEVPAAPDTATPAPEAAAAPETAEAPAAPAPGATPAPDEPAAAAPATPQGEAQGEAAPDQPEAGTEPAPAPDSAQPEEAKR